MKLSPILLIVILFIGFFVLKLIKGLLSITESVVGTITQIDIAKKKKLSSILNKLSTICLIGIACIILYLVLLRKIPKMESIPLSSIEDLPY